MTLGKGIAIAGIWLGAGFGMLGAALGDTTSTVIPFVALCGVAATFFAALFSS